MSVDVLQTALAAEHAALYVYGYLGARTSQSANPLVFSRVAEAFDVHRAYRDLLVGRLREQGVVPVAAEPSYEVPRTSLDVAGVLRAAADVEARCAQTYSFAVAGSSGADRRWAVEALTGAALRQVAFGREPGPFPGAPDLG